MGTYQYKNCSESFTIENGIIKGVEQPFSEKINNFGEFLLDKMKVNRDCVGQVDAVTGKEYTYASMIDRSIRCALWLRRQNIEPGDIIAICTENHVDQIIPALAALYIGVIFTPWLNVNFTSDRVKYLINSTQPKIIFANEACAKVTARVTKEINFNIKIVTFGQKFGQQTFKETIEEAENSEMVNFRCMNLSSTDYPAYILFTSGIMAFPKGVLHSHKSLFGNTKNFQKMNNNYRSVLNFSTLARVTGIVAYFSYILDGKTTIILGFFDPEDICKTIEKYKIEYMVVWPPLAKALVRSDFFSEYNMTSVTNICTGDISLRKKLKDLLLGKFINLTISHLYGCTESGGMVTFRNDKYRLNSIGKIAANCQLKIIDLKSGDTLDPNEHGEICVNSPFMMCEYWKNPLKTQESIDAEGWYHTGDFGYYNKSGTVFLINRIEELIKWRGHYVAPAMLEHRIRRIPKVLDVAIIGVPDFEDCELPMAFVVTNSLYLRDEQIHRCVNKYLPQEMKLKAVMFIDEIPTYPISGKVIRSQLKTMAKNFLEL